MNRLKWTLATAVAYLALVLAWLVSFPGMTPSPAAEGKADQDSKAMPASEVFGPTRVWNFHLTIPAEDWGKMEPRGRMRFPGGRPGFGPREPDKAPEKAPAKPADKPTDVHKGSGFGVEFPWAHAELTADGKTFKNLGVRFKGNASYMASSRGLKRNFKLAFDHYSADQRFSGMKKLNLNAGAMDPSKLREVLAYSLFRKAGVPAPRTALAAITLDVPGKHTKEFLGLYTLVEQVDRTFLKARFKNGKGLLLKPERLHRLEYLGDDWAAYKDLYRPRHEPSKKEARRLIEFIRLVSKADDERFRKEIGSYLDVDGFLRFMAVNALIVNLDSFFTLGHNYYIYLDPETNRFTFIPWDMDLSFAGFPMGGSAEQQMDLSLMHPHAGKNPLIDRLLAMEDVKQRYRAILKEISERHFTREALLKEVDALEKATREPLAKEKQAAAGRKEKPMGPGRPGMMTPAPGLRSFIDRRVELVAAQLAGKREGQEPKMGFGPGKFGPDKHLAKLLLTAMDGNKDGKVTKEELLAGAGKFFDQCDKDKKGKIGRKTLEEGLNRIIPHPPGMPGGGPPGPERDRPRFGPGTAAASSIMKRAGAEKEGKLSRDQFIEAAKALFEESDKGKQGWLDEKALAGAIRRILPPMGPPMGPPGVPPGKEGKP